MAKAKSRVRRKPDLPRAEAVRRRPDFEGPEVGARRAAIAANRRAGGEPAVCDRCGAVLVNRVWRSRRVPAAVLDRASWRTCPACRQVDAKEFYGRIVIRGAFARQNEKEIRQRIRNVEERARFTQPQRRVVAADREGQVLEVLTTSQRLAHRVVRELKKTFRGRAAYHWDEHDGSLYAVWERDA